MGRRYALVALLVVAVAAAAVLATKALSDNNEEDVFLEGVADTGQNPFTTAAFVAEVTTTTTAVTGESTTTAKPGLFGGSGNQKVCDPAKLIEFLTTHADKAGAWVAALNADPTLTWSGTTPLKVSDIPAYIAELAPTFLSADTRVTNHGFLNGRPTPHQSVLQKGTAVLVDKQGIPRARCACGNPLIPPHKVDHPHYRGHKWPGWPGPYCAPPGCTEPTTTTSSSTSTTVASTTSTTGCDSPNGCTNTSLQRRSSTTRPQTGTTATVPRTTTTRPTQTTQQQGTTSSTQQGGKP
jgi:hypothetical protein